MARTLSKREIDLLARAINTADEWRGNMMPGSRERDKHDHDMRAMRAVVAKLRTQHDAEKKEEYAAAYGAPVPQPNASTVAALTWALNMAREIRGCVGVADDLRAFDAQMEQARDALRAVARYVRRMTTPPHAVAALQWALEQVESDPRQQDIKEFEERMQQARGALAMLATYLPTPQAPAPKEPVDRNCAPSGVPSWREQFSAKHGIPLEQIDLPDPPPCPATPTLLDLVLRNVVLGMPQHDKRMSDTYARNEVLRMTPLGLLEAISQAFEDYTLLMGANDAAR